MKYKVIVKKFEDLTTDEYAACYRLNLRDSGAMQGVLSLHRRIYKNEDLIEYCPNIRVYMVKDLDKLLGWGILFPLSSTSEERGYRFYTYVRHSHRRLGIGCAIFDMAYKQYSMLSCYRKSYSLAVYPHDEKSRAFYTKATMRKNNRIRIWDYGNV